MKTKGDAIDDQYDPPRAGESELTVEAMHVELEAELERKGYGHL